MEYKLLRKIPILEGLNDQELEKLSKLMLKKTYQKNEILFHEGDIGNSMYIVKTGKIKVLKTSEDGKEKILSIFADGDFFGEMAILDSENRSATIEAMEESEVYVLYKDDFVDLLKTNFYLVMKIFSTLSERVRNLNRKVEILTFEDVKVRFADVVVELMEKYGEKLEDNITIDLQLTHKDLANMLGITRETMTRLITKLKKQNIIDVIDRKIVILNKEKLAELAGK